MEDDDGRARLGTVGRRIVDAAPRVEGTSGKDRLGGAGLAACVASMGGADPPTGNVTNCASSSPVLAV